MDASVRQPWARAVILLGAVYLFVGIVSVSLAGSAETQQVRVIWRLTAWAASAAVFAAHIGYEHFRLGNSTRVTALHAALAVAVGAFGLAVAATVHSLSAASGHLHGLLLALVIWPILTGVPAFLVALVAAAVMARLPRSARA